MKSQTTRKLQLDSETEHTKSSAFVKLFPKPLKALLDSQHVADIFSSRNHSEDFQSKRAEYILLRIRWLALMFSIAIPLWIPIDYVTLNAEHFGPMAAARCALAAALAVLYRISHLPHSPQQTSALLFLLMLLPALFYAASLLILHSGHAEEPLAGYAFQPYLLVCFSAIFPLTLLGSLQIFSLVFLTYLGTQWLVDQLTSLTTLNGIWMFCLFAGAVLWAQYSQLHMLLQLYRESTCDYLTGLWNRRLLMKRLDVEIERATQQQYCFSLIMIDLDRFKRINDQYGHNIGDQVLVTFSQVLKRQLRSSDVPARYGGEEFVVLLPGANHQEALQIAQRLLVTFQNQAITLEDDNQLFATASMGIAEYRAGETKDAMLNRADEALYQAKRRGRNCIVTKSDDQFRTTAFEPI